jgi:hypothetical protein
MWEYDIYRLAGFYPLYAKPPSWWVVESNPEEEKKYLKEHIEMLKEELKVTEADLKELEAA